MRQLAFLWFVGLIASFILWMMARNAPRKRFFRVLRWLANAQLALVLAAPVGIAGYVYWYTHRPLPEPTTETLYEGITYVRDVREEPQPVVAHVVSIDLDAPGLGFLVTPGEPVEGQEVPARRTTEFADEFDLQLAINGDFFEPWTPSTNTKPGDLLDVKGFATSRGLTYSDGHPIYPTLFLSDDNQASIGEPVSEVYNAISGDYIFLENGIFQEDGLRWPYHFQRHPRTAVALDADARTLILIVVDGRQPNYSEGVTIEELAEIVMAYGGTTALNLDGGGSATLVAEDENGVPVKLNSPIDHRIPGRERPVANHLGVYAFDPPGSAETAEFSNLTFSP